MSRWAQSGPKASLAAKANVEKLPMGRAEPARIVYLGDGLGTYFRVLFC
jgi:hypothetical protein